MNLVIVELGLIIVAIILSTFITHTGNLMIESRLDGIQNSLNYLIRYVSDSMTSIVCKKQSEDKKQSPHLPINRDDIDDDGWRKP
ncbi:MULTISPECIES: hypothetical protein [Oscillatoriales]|uniref:Uncharacterized protein n=1 Tax=Limnospira platensis NIES-46 TaxID=1236695 RepID=A0A5M3TDI0_LIMPL|nr:hypothetical protein AP285_16045 [Arthrospira platensis YZ]KDR58519.1 hypothetical protein APPUASWS_004640 [Arthrospira platensis str. Paraca]MDF2213135.1 hypothetical protein [Arthrospira platensis NCB002]QQW27125.1 hypothetical protein AP9108_17460 [Arthrospira sp. PCC 9108]BDT13769.1 hypothetical protein N39L_34920 [Arthrospira platensis NIES-39]GCE96772.1 hypothetical protein NIES46_48450 [Arthrospira platensis NIES-46]